ncbi:MAG TPA: alpha/beta hydrolase [Candidatus Saccharimonadales bacterium]|nr:alpha/beta hydrolase [Candidatus Saccharimonadales bacterium]
MDYFLPRHLAIKKVTIAARIGGSGPPLLLLHGFPETQYMWRELAPLLARHFTVVTADLRGYGESSCPPSSEDHMPYSKRTMAEDMVGVMQELGFDRFAVIGHDRGARVAYRMALDYPKVVTHLAVFDIVPTDLAWQKADSRMMLGFWPWSLLAQPAPLPERILATNAAEIVNNTCESWGSLPSTFPAEVRDVYIKALSDSNHIHAICEEYRAAATIDRTHDEADRQAQRIIACPTLVLWGSGGALDTWYTEDGGPLSLWRTIAPNAAGEAVTGGHFFPEENPEETYEKLYTFLSR